MKLKYVSKRGKEIIFDDYCDETQEEDLGGYWVYMCKHHHRMYRHVLKGKFDDTGCSTYCSVDGCWREADYYVDFGPEEVKEVDE